MPAGGIASGKALPDENQNCNLPGHRALGPARPGARGAGPAAAIDFPGFLIFAQLKAAHLPHQLGSRTGVRVEQGNFTDGIVLNVGDVALPNIEINQEGTAQFVIHRRTTGQSGLVAISHMLGVGAAHAIHIVVARADQEVA